uniref:glutamate-rich protein 2 isoform X4 n=1 Tax=Scatophagus argus TaxID=75038 RepID=UPI001ED80F20|nr:glutamate-rich protein 2 isoform X4 [Scatophagus argus]
MSSHSDLSPWMQLAVEVMSAHAEMHKPHGSYSDYVPEKVGERTVTDKPRSPPTCALLHSVQTRKSVFPSGEALNTDECSPKDSINITPRVEEQAQLTAVPDDKLKTNDSMKAQPPDSAVTGGTTHDPPPAESLPMHERNGEEEQIEEEDAEDEDLKAPVELIIKFLRAVMDRDFQLASKLCQMILIYEPDNPEASEFLPLIHKKLLEEQEEEQSPEEDEDEDEEDDSASDEESSRCTSCSSSSCSSSSPSDDDEEDEERVNRYKPCPPCHICP